MIVFIEGEVAELAEGARLLSECGVKSFTAGSNPALSADVGSLRQGRKVKIFGHIFPLNYVGREMYNEIER